MKAMLMTAAGGPDVLQPADLPDPEIITPTQIKVRLEAAGVNPVDTKLRSRGVFYPDALPAILGCDGAGTVVETGRAVNRFSTGDEVWFCHGGLGGAPGNYARYTVLEQTEAELKPSSSSFEEAAALPLVLITAWEALFDRARLEAGQHVLIHAGAGGVGHVAIQLAKSIGANVATTVSTDEKAEFVTRLGADRVVRYKAVDFVDDIMAWTGGKGVDVVLDSLGGDTFQRSLGAARVYGHVNTLLDPGSNIDWKEARNRNLSISFTLMLTPMLKAMQDARHHQGEILRHCAELIEAGKLQTQVSKVFALEDTAKAHALIEEGHVSGKIVLNCNP
jgi:NADPH2:quinone reductase